MDRIINWLLLVIVFVFDPLAIALVIAANFAFARIAPKENLYGEKVYEEVPEWNIKEEEQQQNSQEEEVQQEKSTLGKILRKQPNRYLVDLGNGVQEWIRKRDYFRKNK